MNKDFYKKEGSYYQSGSGQKIANLEELQGFAKAGGKEIDMPTLPGGATKISDPTGLKGLSEKDIFRQGQDIYRLPEVSNNLTSSNIINPNVIPTADPGPDLTDISVAGKKAYQDSLSAKTVGENSRIKEREGATQASQERMSDYQASMVNKQPEYKQERNELGYTEDFEQKRTIDAKRAEIYAQYEKAMVAEEGRLGSAGSIYGRQALMRRQMSAELSGLSAMSDALSGNMFEARSAAKESVDMKYDAITKQHEMEVSQLNFIYKDLDRADKAKADTRLEALKERERLINEQKANESGINEVMLLVAGKGASTATLEGIMKSKTPAEAIIKAKDYIKIESTPTKIGQDKDGNDLFYDPRTSSFKTSDQLTINNIGTQVGTISGLPSYNTRDSNPGMNRSDRNNNPGNIKVSSYTKKFEGVIGVESSQAEDGGNFLIFENAQAGLDAIGRLLLEGDSYQDVNAETAIKKYNGGGAYGAEDIGLDPNGDFQSQIQDINKRREVARKMAMAEGWSGKTMETVDTPQISQSAQNWANLISQGKADITNVPADERSSVVDALAITPNEGDQLGDIVAKEKAQQALDLKDSKGLASAVGPVGFRRIAAPWNIAEKQDFIAGVEQLVSGLSLDSLSEAKSRGATFGALSDTEMSILAASATKIGSWKNMKDGKVTGYSISEKAFKKELETINKILMRGVKENTINQLANEVTEDDPLGIFSNDDINNPLGL